MRPFANGDTNKLIQKEKRNRKTDDNGLYRRNGEGNILSTHLLFFYNKRKASQFFFFMFLSFQQKQRVHSFKCGFFFPTETTRCYFLISQHFTENIHGASYDLITNNLVSMFVSLYYGMYLVQGEICFYFMS